MAKKKKDLDIKLDTANVDVSVVRKDGKTDIEIETPIATVDVEKEADSTKVEVVTKTKAGATILKVLRAIKALK
jgi:hypothetical protein